MHNQLPAGGRNYPAGSMLSAQGRFSGAVCCSRMRARSLKRSGEGHALHPADHEERPELDVVVGMVVGDEDRAELLEGEPGLREAVGDPSPQSST